LFYVFQCTFKPSFAYMSSIIPFPGMGSNDYGGSSSGKSALVETSSSAASLDVSDESGAGTSSSGHGVDPLKDGVDLNL
jgi:hypothetical protein